MGKAINVILYLAIAAVMLTIAFATDEEEVLNRHARSGSDSSGGRRNRGRNRVIIHPRPIPVPVHPAPYLYQSSPAQSYQYTMEANTMVAAMVTMATVLTTVLAMMEAMAMVVDIYDGGYGWLWVATMVVMVASIMEDTMMDITAGAVRALIKYKRT